MKKIDKKAYMKKYYLEHKEIMKAQSKKWIEENYNYKANRKKINKEHLQYLKKVNYRHEKTPEQRKIRSIKRKTRYHFPLLNNKCIICDNLSMLRHHTTKPIKYNKFEFMCNPCHRFTHKVTKLEVKIKNGKHD